MSDQEEASSSASSTFTAINTSGNVVALRDVIVNQTTNVEALKKIVTTFKLFDRPTRNFTGRKNLLKEIHEKMKECSRNENCLDRIVVLSGLGGIGKSELARKYAQTYITDSIIKNVAWIDAEEEGGMKTSFKNLARALKIPIQNMELKEIIQEVYDYFSNHIKTGLFIFDNSKQMNDRPFGIYEYLPIQESIKHRPLLLLTARCNEWDIENKNNIINIHELSQGESIDLLEKKFRLAKESENYEDYRNLLGNVADALQGYPLGLALATSNIKFHKNWTALKAELEAYLERMTDPDEDWIDDEQPDAATKYKLIMKNVWEMTLEKIKDLGKKGKNAIKLLNIISYLPPDNIEKDQVEHIFKYCYSTSLSSKEFKVLEKYSLIKIENREHGDEDEYFIRIHRLVQLTTQAKLDRGKDLSYLKHLCKFFSYANYHMKYDNSTTLMGLHGFLKSQNWPRSSIKLSLVFCSIMAVRINWDEALSLAKDIETFLNIGDAKEAANVNDEHFVNLFFLCRYLINENYSLFESRSKFILDENECDNIIISMIRQSTGVLLSSKERPQSLEEYSYFLCLVLLPYLIILKKNLLSQLIPLINSALNSTNCCSVERLSMMYEFMWGCLESDVPEALTLLKPVLNAHFQVYDRLGSQDEFCEYWNADYTDKAPLNLYFINEELEKIENREIGNGEMRGFKATNEFVEAFILAGGLRILCHYTVYVTNCIKHHWNNCGEHGREFLNDLLRTIRSLALYLGKRDEFVKSVEFLSAFSNFTKLIFKELDHLTFKIMLQENCTMVWLCLYSRQKPDESNTVASIHTIAPLLEKTLGELELEDDDDWSIDDTFDNEFVIRQFLDTFKDEPDCTAVQAVQNILKDDKEYSESAVFALQIDNLRVKDKVKIIKKSNENAWRLLSILVFAKRRTYKNEIADLFEFMFYEDINKDALAALKNHSLLIKYDDAGSEVCDFVRVKRCVRIWIKAELQNENNHKCLLDVFTFIILHNLKHINTYYLDFDYLHKYLQDLRWPQNSTCFSMIFSLFLTQLSSDLNTHALSILNDIYEFQESSQMTNSNEPNWFATENFQLFQLCIFWVDPHVEVINMRHRMWDDLNLNKGLLANVFVTSIEPAIQHFLNPQRNLTLVQNFLTTIPMYILRKLPEEAGKLAADLRQRIFLSILESFNASTGCATENVLDMFEFLWDYYKHACFSYSVVFLGTVFSMHFQVYASYASFSQAQLARYWGYGGPLNLQHVIKAWKHYSEPEKNCVAECFFENHGPQIIIGFFNFWEEHPSNHGINATNVYDFIRMIAYDLNLARKFIEFPEFLCKFSHHIQHLNKQDLWYSYQVQLVSAWFSLFAKHDARRNMDECNFFFKEVANTLQEILVSIEEKHFRYLNSESILLTEEILETFLKTFSDKSDTMVFKAAVRLHRLCRTKTEKEDAAKRRKLE